MDRKLLIVDDQASMRRLLQMALEELEDDGVEILVAEDGQEALALVEEERPNLVLLDVMMPKMNGFEVCDTIKNKLGFRDITIIILTAKGQESDRIRGDEVGADLYVTKPFDPDELYETACKILGL